MKSLIITLTAMAIIGVLINTALNNGVNGVMFSGAMVAISGLGGYRLKIYRDERGKKVE